MAQIQFVDELVKEYLLFRGFTSTVKAFDTDLKADKDKGFRVDKITEQITHFINVSDLNGLKEYWSHLDNFVFSKLEIHFQPVIRKMEYSLYKLYLVTATQGSGGVKNEHVTEFLSKMLPELQGQSEWKEWFMLPYIQKPEENLSFSIYYTRHWQDSVLVSLHNLLATVFQCMPQPTLTSYESDAVMVKRLQDELAMLRLQGKITAEKKLLNTDFTTLFPIMGAQKLIILKDHDATVSLSIYIETQQQPTEKTSPISQSKQLSDRLQGPSPLMDDFYALPSESMDSGLKEAKGLRGLIRQMGGSPVMGRKPGRPQSQN